MAQPQAMQNSVSPAIKVLHLGQRIRVDLAGGFGGGEVDWSGVSCDRSRLPQRLVDSNSLSTFSASGDSGVGCRTGAGSGSVSLESSGTWVG